MKRQQIRAMHHWQAMFEDEAVAPHYIFRTVPGIFLEISQKSGILSRFDFKKCTAIIKSSEWRNELALIFICLVIDKEGNYVTGAPDLIKSCERYLSECSRIVGGKNQVRHDYHLKPYYAREYAEMFRAKNPKKLNDQLIFAIEITERVLSKLPANESKILSTFQLGLLSEDFEDGPESNTIDTLRNLMPDHLKFLRATMFDPAYKGQLPERPLLKFLCQKLTMTDFAWSSHLISYTAIKLSKGASQASILRKLDNMFIFLFLMHDRDYNEDFAVTIRENTRPKYEGEIARTLEKHPDLECRMAFWHYITSLGLKAQPIQTSSLKSQPIQQKIDWRIIISRTTCAEYLQLMIGDQLNLSSSDDIQIKMKKYLWKWRSARYFSQLVLLGIGLALNQEHRPESAMQIMRGVRRLLERVVQVEMRPLNAQTILDVLESSQPDDPQDTARLRYLAIAYRSAWQSQQTFLLRQRVQVEMPGDLLLPELPRPPVFSRSDNSVHALRQQRRQSAIDVIAQWWDELHRWGDYQLVALRTVLLAFHEATWNQDPRHTSAPQRLDVAIPGQEKTWHFTIWTGRLFHRQAFGRQTEPTITEEYFFLEYRGASGTSWTRNLWCEDLFRTWFCPEAARRFEVILGRSTEWLRPSDPGVLGPGRSFSRILRPAVKALQAQGHSVPCIFRPELVYRAALFGALALRLSREGAHRGHESLQLRSDRDYLFLHTYWDQETVFMKLLPKGHKGTRSRPETPAYKVVSVSALRCLEAIQHHRWLTREEFSASHIVNAGQYAFQVNQRVISLRSLNVCLRFLTYGFGMTSPAEPDQALNLTSHLLRYGFAINARQKGIHLDDLALALNHKNVETSAFYSRPTALQQRNTLARVAQQVSGQRATEMTPDLPAVLPDDLWPLTSPVQASSFEQWLRETEQELEQREKVLIQQMRGLS